MNISENGKNLIKSFEKCELTAYKATSREPYFTIGWGHYGADVKAGQTISQSQADAMFEKDIKKYEALVKKYPNAYTNQNQYDALCSFCYNIGSIDQLTANGTRTIAQISARIPAYCTQKGVTLAGLVTRRAKEKALYDTACTVQSTPVTSSGNDVIKAGQQHSINFTGHQIEVDGIRGPETVRQQIHVLQNALNLDYNAKLDVDGIWGKHTSDALGRHYVKSGEKQYMVTAAEILCMMHGIAGSGVECPGIFGAGLARATGTSKLTYDWFVNMARN